MNQITRDEYLGLEGRLQALEQQISTLQQEIQDMKKIIDRIIGSLNAVVDFVNLDTQLEYPGFGADLRRV